MRKENSLFILFLIVFCAACKKESPDLKENYIKAKIDGQEFIVYESNSLNEAVVSDSHSFGFGQGIYSGNGKVDTCLYIKVTQNGRSFGITFPLSSAPKTYELHCTIDSEESQSGIYIPDNTYIKEEGIEIFHTHKMAASNVSKDTKVGEICISRINTRDYEISGTFSFSAYSFQTSTGETVATNKMIQVSDGEFYYHWNKSQIAFR
jgi:hypothetical protein